MKLAVDRSMCWDSVTSEARGGLGARSWAAAALAASRTCSRSPARGRAPPARVPILAHARRPLPCRCPTPASAEDSRSSDPIGLARCSEPEHRHPPQQVVRQGERLKLDRRRRRVSRVNVPMESEWPLLDRSLQTLELPRRVPDWLAVDEAVAAGRGMPASRYRSASRGTHPHSNQLDR